MKFFENFGIHENQRERKFKCIRHSQFTTTYYRVWVEVSFASREKEMCNILADGSHTAKRSINRGSYSTVDEIYSFKVIKIFSCQCLYVCELVFVCVCVCVWVCGCMSMLPLSN